MTIVAYKQVVSYADSVLTSSGVTLRSRRACVMTTSGFASGGNLLLPDGDSGALLSSSTSARTCTCNKQVAAYGTSELVVLSLGNQAQVARR
jgi:hypothetical protein